MTVRSTEADCDVPARSLTVLGSQSRIRVKRGFQEEVAKGGPCGRSPSWLEAGSRGGLCLLMPPNNGVEQRLKR